MMYRNSALSDPADAHRIGSLSMFYMSIGDGAEGVAAFREKRNPTFPRRRLSRHAAVLRRVIPPDLRAARHGQLLSTTLSVPDSAERRNVS